MVTTRIERVFILVRPVAVAVVLAGIIYAVPAESEAQQCFPTCREGFLCAPNGQCVSACNPSCSAGYICTSGRQCAAAGAPPTVGPSQTFAPAPPVPSFAAPSPERTQEGETERQRLRELRGSFHFGIFGAGGVQVGHLDPAPSRNGTFNIELFGPAFELGVFVRQNFAYRVGYHIRFDVGFGSDSTDAYWDSRDGSSGGNYDYSGFSLGFHLEGMFKLGPLGQRFPMYIDFGGHAGVVIVNGSLEPDSSGYGEMEGAEMDLPSLSTVHLGLGPSAALGFIFGEREELDLSIRGRLSFASAGADEGMNLRVQLVFGYAFL